MEYRNISKWVKISTPSIYKKVIQLEEKGLIKSNLVKEGKMAEKAVYSLTGEGEKEFKKLMFETASKPVRMFLDLNAVIVNLDSLSEEEQGICLTAIEDNVKALKSYLEENIYEKKDMAQIPEAGKAVLQQQYILVQAIEKWLDSIKNVKKTCNAPGCCDILS